MAFIISCNELFHPLSIYFTVSRLFRLTIVLKFISQILLQLWEWMLTACLQTMSVWRDVSGFFRYKIIPCERICERPSCVCVCMRACMRVCVCVCVSTTNMFSRPYQPSCLFPACTVRVIYTFARYSVHHLYNSQYWCCYTDRPLHMSVRLSRRIKLHQWEFANVRVTVLVLITILANKYCSSMTFPRTLNWCMQFYTAEPTCCCV